jgi:hypothetical protein
LEHRFLAGLGKFSKVLLHAGLDPALAGRDLLQNRLISGLHAPQDLPRRQLVDLAGEAKRTG